MHNTTFAQRPNNTQDSKYATFTQRPTNTEDSKYATFTQRSNNTQGSNSKQRFRIYNIHTTIN